MANWQQTYEQLKKKKKEIDNAKSVKEINKINQKYEVKPNALNESYAPTNKLPLQMPSYTKAPATTIKKKEEKRTWFSGGAFKDGYDFGDVTKTILGTAGDIGVNALRGVASAGEGLAKVIVGGTAEVSDWVGADDFSKKLKNRLAGKDEEFNKRKEKYFVSSNLNKASDKLDSSSLIGEKLDDLSSSVGNLGASMAGQTVGIPWYVTMGGSSAGHELENAYTKGASTGEAWGSAVITGASEVLLEKLSGGIKFGGKTLDDGAKRLLSDAITNKTAQTLAKFGLDVLGEGTEEVLTEVVQNVGKKLTYEDEQTWKEILASEEALDSYLESFIGGAVMGGGFNAMNLKKSLQTGQDYDSSIANVKDIKEVQSDIAPVNEQVNEQVQQPINPQETVEDIDNQIVALEEKLMATENDAEYEKLSNQIKELEIRAEQIENGTVQPTVAPIQENAIQNNEIAPVQMANVEQTNQPTTQQTESNLATEVESNTQNNTENQLSEELVKEIQNKTLKANENKADVKIVSTNEVTPNSRNGGYRTQEQIDSLTNDIKQNGIVTPIEVKVENGKVEVVNGHHRLKIAKDLGIKEIPVKYVNQNMENIDNSQEVLYNNENKESLNYVEGEFESGNRNRSGINEENARSEINEANSINNNVTLENEGTTRGYDKVSNEVQGDNDGPPSTTTSEQNTTPTQAELDNLEYTRKNKSGSEYASAFYDLDKKYGSANLYKGLNHYKSTGKALDNDIAPIRQELAETTKELVKTIKDTKKEVTKLNKGLNEAKETIKDLKEQIAPVKEDIDKTTTMDDLEGWEAQTREEATKQDIAPIRNNLTEEESLELDMYDNMPSDLSQEEQARQQELEDIENNNFYLNDTMTLDKKSLKALSKNIKDSLDLNNKQRAELENAIQEYSMRELATKEDLHEIIENKFGKQSVETKLDDVIDVQRAIKRTKIKPTDDLRQMTDYFQTKQKNFGRISMSNSGMEIDKVYQELSDEYRNFFPETITNPADQFERIIEVANMDKTLSEDIILPEETIQDITDFVYESVQDYKYAEYVKSSNAMYEEGWENLDIPISEEVSKEDVAPVLTVSPEVKQKPKQKTTPKNVDWETLEDTSKGNQQQYDLETQTINDENISELEKKKQRELKKLGKKEDYISNKASELYDELKHLRKGTKASYELSNILDFSFANINELTKGKTDTAIKEIKNKIYRNITTGLLNVESKPSTIVNENSKIEAKIRQSISQEYDTKVKEINNLKEENLKTKKQIKQELLQKTGIMNVSLDNANKLPKMLMENTDPIRLQEMIFGRDLGNQINKMFFQKVKDNTSEKIRFQNKERADIKALGIKARSKESSAVQKYGEKQWTNETTGETLPYGDKELASEFPDIETQKKIKRASEIIRNKYDAYLDRTNEVLTKLGYDAIPKRKDYMRHFQELNDIFSRVGIPYNYNEMTSNDLPTDINGLTADFSPSKNFFASTLQRKGNKTTYDAITGIDGYLEGIGNLIYHTEDIQRLRAYEQHIRDTYGENHGFDNLETLSNEEKVTRIEKIQDNHLSNYASWLHEYTNTLAGKKALIDRSIESLTGRKIYSFLNTAKTQVGRNMIGFNLSSAMTNAIAGVQTLAKTNKIATVKGLSDTVKNIFVKDNFVEKNNFLTSRFGSDRLSKNLWQRIGDTGFVFMQGTDYFVSNFVVRSKYNELKAKGLSDSEAHAEAGKYASRLMSDRSQGATPNIYNSQMLGIVTQFQNEVNNQLYSMFYDTYHESKESAKGNAIKTAAGMTFTLGQMAVFTHLFGKAFEELAGYNPTLDIIDILMKALGLDDEEGEEEDVSKNLSQAWEQLSKGLPYISIITGGGRIPVSEALPIEELFTGKDEYGNDKSRLETIKEALPYHVLPTGYSQYKKTTKGLGMYDEDLPIAGSYTDSGNLRFTAEEDTWSIIQSGLFGQWANKEAQAYVDSEFKTINKSNIEELIDLGMVSSEYRKLKSDINKSGKKVEDKVNYIATLDELNDNQKNILVNNILDRDYDVDVSNYEDYGSYEEFDYSYRNPEKYEWLKSEGISYDEYSASDDSKELYNYAYKYPETYKLGKSITGDFATYKEYADYIWDLKADKDENGDSISGTKKTKVIEYVNGLDLSIPQKAMLIRKTYSSFDDYNYDIVDYVDSLDMPYEDKTIILKALDMEVSDDGTISW